MKTKGAARERTGAVGRRHGTRHLHTHSLRGSMQEEKERAREKREPLTLKHVGHCRHIPAANVLVEHDWIEGVSCKHCAGHTRATSNTSHTTPTRRMRPGQSSKRSSNEFAARERTAAVGRRRGTRPLHTQSLRGSIQKGKALTLIHCGHFGHVPAANVLVERTCSSPFLGKP